MTERHLHGDPPTDGRGRGRHRATSTRRSTVAEAVVPLEGVATLVGLAGSGHHDHGARAAACRHTTPSGSTSPQLAPADMVVGLRRAAGA